RMRIRHGRRPCRALDDVAGYGRQHRAAVVEIFDIRYKSILNRPVATNSVGPGVTRWSILRHDRSTAHRFVESCPRNRSLNPRTRGEDMHKTRGLVVLAALLALPLAACGNADTGSSGSGGSSEASGVCGSTDASGDLLAAICDKGTITVSTDPKYPPQSSFDEKTGEYVGFDIDVATEIAKRLGVGIDWQTPNWNAITAGSWNGRWDMSVGSMTPTND